MLMFYTSMQYHIYCVPCIELMIDDRCYCLNRSGSVIVDLSLKLKDPDVSFQSASKGIVKNLNAKGYELDADPFVVSGKLFCSFL